MSQPWGAQGDGVGFEELRKRSEFRATQVAGTCRTEYCGNYAERSSRNPSRQHLKALTECQVAPPRGRTL